MAYAFVLRKTSLESTCPESQTQVEGCVIRSSSEIGECTLSSPVATGEPMNLEQTNIVQDVLTDWIILNIIRL